MKARDIYIIGGLAVVGIWFVRKQLLAAANAALAAPGELGSKIGLALFDWVNPNAGKDITATQYMTTFPDGVKHSVGAQFVNAQGRFKWQGVLMQLKRDAAGKAYAVKV